MDVDFRRLYRVVLIMDGRGRTRQIVYFIHFYIERKRDVMSGELEIWITEEMLYISFAPCEEVINTKTSHPSVTSRSQR
jgi:hypothetical protein